MMDYGSNSGGWGWGAWLLMSLMMLIFWSVAVGLSVVAYHHFREQHRPMGPAAET